MGVLIEEFTNELEEISNFVRSDCILQVLVVFGELRNIIQLVCMVLGYVRQFFLTSFVPVEFGLVFR